MGFAARDDGALTGPRIEYVWRPQAGPQKALIDCPFPEIFFGGARGGGKTDGVLGKWALKEERYGQAFNARMFRRTVVSSEDAIERSKHIYGPLGGKFDSVKNMWRMPNGGRVGFSYLDSVDDADHQQGKNLTDAWIEEAGQYPELAPIDRLFGALRSADGVPVQMIVTANPGGAGQHWIAKRYGMIPFPKSPKIVHRELPDGSVHKMAVIPSRITDNRLLIQSDPGYISRLQLVGSPALVKAWLEGDWSAIEGAFFPEWSTERHVLQPFTIPGDWLRFRSGDWGSAKPFSIGWWAVVGDDSATHGGLAKGQQAGTSILPRGALVRYREWYGSSSPNVGLKLPAEEVAAGIIAREIHEPRDINGNSSVTYGVMDPAAFASDGGPSIAERMADNGVAFRRADNRRVGVRGALGGWDQVRARLIGTGERGESGSINWLPGQAPMMFFFSTCVDSIRTLPSMQHDRARAEDLDSDSEDHACFAAGTEVLGKNGPTPIENMPERGLIFTRRGLLPYRNRRVTRLNSEVVRLSFSDGSVVACTPDHKFMKSTGEYCEAQWFLGQECYTINAWTRSSFPRQSKNLTANASINAADIFKGKAAAFIAWFGNITTDRFPTECTSITRTMTPQLTVAAISNFSLARNTSAIAMALTAPNALLNHFLKRTTQQKCGTVAMRGDGGILGNLRDTARQLLPLNLKLCANNAVQNINARLSTLIGLNGAVRSARPVRCVAVERLKERKDVYCLTVPNEGNFALGNGMIVKNCDEIRYACMSRPWINEVPQKSKPRFLQDATLDDLWEHHTGRRSNGRI